PRGRRSLPADPGAQRPRRLPQGRVRERPRRDRDRAAGARTRPGARGLSRALRARHRARRGPHLGSRSGGVRAAARAARRPVGARPRRRDRVELLRPSLPDQRPEGPVARQPAPPEAAHGLRPGCELAAMSTRIDVAVQCEGLVKEFRSGLGLRSKRVLRGVSFSVRAGEIFGFVGPNGAGKTTTLKILMGLIRATSGRASVLGHDVRETEFRRHVGFLPEAPYFYDYLSGREFLRFYARVCGVPRARRPERVDALREGVGLAPAAGARLRTYSRGMLQRVGIAQALVHDPRVVFLDEPMSGLDPIGRKEIRDLIRRLQAEGKTVFMNTHILSDVEMLCDRVAIIVQGEIRCEGSGHT